VNALSFYETVSVLTRFGLVQHEQGSLRMHGLTAAVLRGLPAEPGVDWAGNAGLVVAAGVGPFAAVTHAVAVVPALRSAIERIAGSDAWVKPVLRSGLAETLLQAGLPTEAAAEAAEAVAEAEPWATALAVGLDPAVPLAPARNPDESVADVAVWQVENLLMTAHLARGRALVTLRRPEEALPFLARAREYSVKAGDPGNMGAALVGEASALDALGDHAAALSRATEALECYERASRPPHVIARVRNDIAHILLELGRDDEARDILERATADLESLCADEEHAAARALAVASLRLALHEVDERENVSDAAVAAREQELEALRRVGVDRDRLAVLTHNLGASYLRRDDTSRSVPLLQESLDIALAIWGETSVETATRLRTLATALIGDDPEAAAHLLDRAQAAVRPADAGFAANRARIAYTRLGLSRRHGGSAAIAQAEEALRRAVVAARDDDGLTNDELALVEQALSD